MKIKYYYFLLPFLMDTSAGITLFCFPLYARERFHLEALTIGLMAGALGCLYTGLNFFFEKIEKIININKLIPSGLILITSSYIWLSLARETHLFIFMLSLGAMGHALFWPAFETHITSGKSEKIKKKNLGYFNLGWSTGLTIFGPLVGGFLYQIIGWRAFLIAGLIAMAGLGLTMARFQQESFICDSAPATGSDGNRFNHKLLYLIWFSNFLSFLVIHTVRTFFPLLGLDMKMSPAFIGLILFLPGLAQIIMTLVLKNNPAWSYNLKTIFLGQGLAILGMVLLSLSRITLLIGLGLFLPGFMAGITNYSSNLMSLSQEDSGKKRIGIHEAIIGLAGILAGFWGGGAAEMMGLRAPYASCALLIGAAIVIQLLFYFRLALPSPRGKERKVL